MIAPAIGRRRHHLVRHGVLSLAGGFALALLIAWGCLIGARMPLRQHAELLDPARDPHETMFQSHGRWTRARGAGSAVIFEDRPYFHLAGMGIPLSVRLFGETLNMSDLPEFVRHTPPSSAALRHCRSVETTWCGFPFPLLRSTTATYDDGGRAHQQRGTASPLPATSGFQCPIRHESLSAASGILGPELTITWGALDLRPIQAWVYHATAQRLAPPDHLPLMPIWPGLLANTAIFAPLSWCLFALCRTLRRRVHRWRHPNANPCRQCGYDLEGLTTNHCPECGEQVSA